MKKEFDEDKITKNKLKDPFYRLDYFKEYAFRNPDQKSTKIYFNFMERYGNVEYDFSKIKNEEKKIINRYRKSGKRTPSPKFKEIDKFLR